MVTLQVEGMSCQGCANSIEKALAATKKIKSAHVDLATKRLTVDGQLSANEIAALLSGLGFDATSAG